jgi:hypothetical protein
MRMLSLSAILLLSACCAETQSPAASKPDPFQLIVQVEGRTGVILIESGPAGVVYTVKDRDRQLIIDRATLAELKQEQPEIGHQLERTVVWAGL